MAKVKGIGRSKKYNLMAQVIPIYGFGILLYILYIIYKLTCKEKTKLGSCSTAKANMEKRSDCELVRLQERLLQTEQMMGSIFSKNGHSSKSGRRRRSKTATPMKKEKLRWHFRQITQLMQEGQLEEATPEMEAEELAYGAEWEEEIYPGYEPSDNDESDPSMLEDSPDQPTAEALAEEMEQEEEEVTARKLSIVQEEDEEEERGEENLGEDDEDEEEVEEGEDDSEEEEEGEAEKRHLLCPSSSSQSAAGRKQERLDLEMNEDPQDDNRGRKKISFNDQENVYHYPKQDSYEEEEEEEDEEDEDEGEGMEVDEEGEADEDDPVVEAESLQFSCECCSNPEAEAENGEEECLLMSASAEGDGQIHADTPKEDGAIVLRMRNRRET